ncbi:MAG: type IV secretory system conjugative DNA transfer family protein [Elainella sp.]
MTNITQILNDTSARRVVVGATVFVWMVYAFSIPHSPFVDFLLVFSWFWLAQVTCLMYRIHLNHSENHASFLVKFAIAAALSLLFINWFGVGWGVFWTCILALIIQQSTGGSGKMVLRGNTAKQIGAAQSYYRKSLPSGDDGILWGGVKVPTEEATTHFLVIGTTGSGKTVTLRLFMQSVLPGIGRLNSNKRAVIYDPKTEMVSILEGLGFDSDTIAIMNPFDQRCRPWWISADIETATDAETLANILIPEKKDSKDDEFWRSASILLIKAVVRYLNRVAPQKWTFRDMLLALRSESIIRKMIDDDPRLKHYEQTFGSDKTAANIMASVIAKVERFEPIAALWHKAEAVYGNPPISLTQWTEESKILVLGRSETAETQMVEINRVLITRLSELLLEKRETREPQTFVILDELGSLGNLQSLLKLATEGRSKGVCLAAGFQAESHIQSNFTKEIAETILGQFNHIAALRMRDETTAKWISGLMGKVQGIRYTQSVTKGSLERGASRTVQEQYYEEDAVMPSELTGIPAFRPQQGIGLKGFYMGHLNWWHTYPPNIVRSLAPKPSSDRDFIRMPKANQELEAWDDTDLVRLNIEHLFGREREEFERDFDDRELAEELKQESEDPSQLTDWEAYFRFKGILKDAIEEAPDQEHV